MKVIISGGGTGGHIFPAIAIAQELQARVPGVNILFVGAKGRMEMEKVPQAGYEIIGLDVAGFNRSSLLKNYSLPWKLVKSLYQAWRILVQYKPTVVVGVGGYASGPVLYLANWLRIPTLIQEQNSFAGKTNMILGKKAAKICVAYDHMERFFPKEKIVVTGNPVRKDLEGLETRRNEAMAYFGLDQNKKTILVMGGSLGARSINESMAAGHERISSQSTVQWIWQYGKQGIEKFSRSATGGLVNVKALPFIDRADLAYAAADVLLCRAGALTISEVLIANKPVVLVPSPSVAEDHQTHNARALSDAGAAWMLPDREVVQKGTDQVIRLLQDSGAMTRMKQAQKTLARPGAAAAIVDQIFQINPMAA